MSELFNVTIQDISYHLIKINDTGELQLSTAIKKISNPSDNCDEQGVLLYKPVEQGGSCSPLNPALQGEGGG